MSDLFAAHADPQDIVENPEHVIETVIQPLVVITEEQVLFSTAAAVQPLPHTKPSRGPIAALRAMFLHSSEGAGPTPRLSTPRHYPPRREAFLEDAAMGREMHRL